MKQLNILILIMLITSSCQREKRVDLASININEIEIEKLLSEPGTFEKDKGYILWRYPNYVTYEMEKFRWGEYKFISNNDIMQSKVEIIYDSTGSYPVIMQIHIFEEEAKRAATQILEELKSQYGAPAVLNDAPYLAGYEAYFWSNVKKNQSLIFCVDYFGHKAEPLSGVKIYIIKNETDIVGKDNQYNEMNILDCLIFMHSNWEIEKRKEILQRQNLRPRLR